MMVHWLQGVSAPPGKRRQAVIVPVRDSSAIDRAIVSLMHSLVNKSLSARILKSFVTYREKVEQFGSLNR